MIKASGLARARVSGAVAATVVETPVSPATTLGARYPAAADAAAVQALSLDPDLPEGQMAMGYVHYYGSRDYDNALEAFKLAVALAATRSGRGIGSAVRP